MARRAQAKEEIKEEVGQLPDGWRLDDNLTQGHFEDFFAAFNREESTGSWPEEVGRALRAAIAAGWFVEPPGLEAEIVRTMRLKAVRLAALAVYEHSARLQEEDPNSSGPSPTS